jgi:hypothetical protein
VSVYINRTPSGWEVWMWEVFPDLGSIDSVPVVGVMEFLLEFSDEPMLLVRVEEEFFGGSEQQFIVQPEDTTTPYLDCGQE